MVCRKWLYKYTINSTPLHLVRSTTMTTSHASPPSCTLQPYCGILQMHLGSIGPIRYWNLSLKKDIHSDKVKHSTLSELNHNEIFCLCNIFFLASRIDENSFGTRWMNNRTVFRFFWQPLILVKFFVLLQKHIINSHYQKIILYSKSNRTTTKHVNYYTETTCHNKFCWFLFIYRTCIYLPTAQCCKNILQTGEHIKKNNFIHQTESFLSQVILLIILHISIRRTGLRKDSTAPVFRKQILRPTHYKIDQFKTL
jgi:hypothetical protein